MVIKCLSNNLPCIVVADEESDSAIAKTGPYLRDDILSLNGLDFTTENADPVTSEQEPPAVETSPAVPDPKPPVKKPAKPKWLKL